MPATLTTRPLDAFLVQRAHMIDVLRRVEAGPIPLTTVAGVQRDIERAQLILQGKVPAR